MLSGGTNSSALETRGRIHRGFYTATIILPMTMRTVNWITGLALVALLACAGCGKSNKSSVERIPATMDLAKFSQAFPSPTPEQRINVAKAREGVRYRLYANALEALNGLASDPALTEPQKKAVNDMILGVKQALATAPAAPGQ